jgi:hypothetical protein
MYRALQRAVAERWGHVEELAAVQVELLHALLVAFITANSDPKKPRPRITPLHVPRPGEEAPSRPQRQQIRPRELARHMGGR